MLKQSTYQMQASLQPQVNMTTAQQVANQVLAQAKVSTAPLNVTMVKSLPSQPMQQTSVVTQPHTNDCVVSTSSQPQISAP